MHTAPVGLVSHADGSEPTLKLELGSLPAHEARAGAASGPHSAARTVMRIRPARTAIFPASVGGHQSLSSSPLPRRMAEPPGEADARTARRLPATPTRLPRG